MAERWRIPSPPRGIGNSTLYRYLGDTANALNQLPTFSLSSTVTDMNTSGITANSGSIGFDVGSSATTFYMKESDGTQGWSSIASHGYVEAYADSIVTFVPAFSVMYHNDGGVRQEVNSTPSTMTIWTNQGPTLGISADTVSGKFTINSAGTYEVNVQSSFSANVNAYTWDMHLAKNDTALPFGFHRYLGTAQDVGSASFVGSIITAASNDSISVLGGSDSANLRWMGIYDAQFSIKKLQ